jgi:hypothetical protein
MPLSLYYPLSFFIWKLGKAFVETILNIERWHNDIGQKKTVFHKTLENFFLI